MTKQLPLFDFVGQVYAEAGGTTHCPDCRAALIVRDWYRIDTYRLTAEGNCPHCGTAIAGRFGPFDKPFGQKRIPIRMHMAA